MGGAGQATPPPVRRLGTRFPGALKDPGLAPWTCRSPRFCWPPDPLQIANVQFNISGRVLSVVNQLYLEAHRGWAVEQTPPETPSETTEKHDAGELGRALGPPSHGSCCRSSVGLNPLLTSSPQEPRPSPGLLGGRPSQPRSTPSWASSGQPGGGGGEGG